MLRSKLQESGSALQGAKILREGSRACQASSNRTWLGSCWLYLLTSLENHNTYSFCIVSEQESHAGGRGERRENLRPCQPIPTTSQWTCPVRSGPCVNTYTSMADNLAVVPLRNANERPGQHGTSQGCPQKMFNEWK